MKHLPVEKGLHISEKAWKPRPDFEERCCVDSCAAVALGVGLRQRGVQGGPGSWEPSSRPAAVPRVREGRGQLPLWRVNVSCPPQVGSSTREKLPAGAGTPKRGAARLPTGPSLPGHLWVRGSLYSAGRHFSEPLRCPPPHPISAPLGEGGRKGVGQQLQILSVLKQFLEALAFVGHAVSL